MESEVAGSWEYLRVDPWENLRASLEKRFELNLGAFISRRNNIHIRAGTRVLRRHLLLLVGVSDLKSL